MTPAERLDAIDDRYGEWYAEHPEDYTGPAASWDERDPGETAEHCIVRNDVPWLLDLARRQDAALRAVLNVCEDWSTYYADLRMIPQVREAIDTALDGPS